jgi:hypothetical protein
MHTLYMMPLAAYCLGFASLAFLPRWRWLVLAGLAAFFLCSWAFYDLSGADGPGAAIAVFVAAALALGFVAGFAARAVILAAGWSGRMIPQASALLSTLVLVPLPTFGWASWHNAVQRARWAPPSAECTSSLHVATLGNMRLALPLAPVISVGQGAEYAPAYRFDVNEQARRFCQKSSGSPPALTNLTLRLEAGPSGPLNLRTSWFCARRQDYGWWDDVCRGKPGDPASEYPVKMTLYRIDRYNAARMHAFSADELGKPPADKGEFADIGGGVVRYSDEHDSYYKRADVPGYLARCFQAKSRRPPELYCDAGYRLTPELGLIYEFRTAPDDFAERSRQVDEKAREIVESLRAR